MLALSIRQPYAELILRGIKTAELRTRTTRIVGERFYIYATKRPGSVVRSEWRKTVWSGDLEPALAPAWMVELARQVGMIEADAVLPLGVIVGSAVIDRVLPPDPNDGDDGLYRWMLKDVKRMKTPRKPIRQPQPVWFEPFE